MNRRGKAVAALGVAGIVTLLWPGPAPSATADTTLGGYMATAYASVVHAQVYEPTIPIPATPQGDISVAYSKATLDTGPASRATASWLWPGDVIGDGFDQLVGKPGATYPVQVNSRYPETETAPAKNAVQITDGNGMATSTDGNTTTGSVTLLGLAGPNTDLLGGVLSGIGQLGGQKPSPAPTTVPQVPLPISSTLAGLVTAQHVTSTSTIELGAKTVTSTAHAAASNISLLGGLISIAGVDVTSRVVSDGSKATPTGSAKIAGVTIAGVNLGLSNKGVDLGPTSAQLPDVSSTVNNLLRTLGIEVSVMPVKNTAQGATGDVSAQVLVISIDTLPLKSALNGPLGAIISLLPKDSQTQLSILLNLAPKIVLTIGDVSVHATSAPAYSGGGSGTGSYGSGSGAAGGGTGSTSGGNTGTGGDIGAGGNLGATNTTPGVVSTATNPDAQPAAMHLPPLGSVPRLMILGALALAAVAGWAIRAAGAVLLGGTRNCSYGLATGVPDLRKG